MTATYIYQPRNIGVIVRARRSEMGLTQNQLAHKANVSERFIAALELGDAPGAQLNKTLAVLQSLGLSLFVESPDGNRDDEPSGGTDVAGYDAGTNRQPAPSASASAGTSALDATTYATLYEQNTSYLHDSRPWRK